MKKKLFPMLMAILMVFALMPMTEGMVFAVADTTPPEVDLTTFKVILPQGKTEVTAGDTVKWTVSATDEGGIDQAYLELCSPSNHSEYPDGTYNAETEQYEFSFTITENSPSGDWTVNGLSFTDTNNNQNYITEGLGAGNFTVAVPLELPTDLSTTGENGAGYKLAFNGTIGNKNYYLTTEENFKPEVKVYYQDKTGARELLKATKYDLKVQRQTSSEGDGTYEDAEFPLTVGENRTAAYKISAAAKEGSGFTGETDAFFVTVTKMCKVTFNTRGGSGIAPQYIIPGETAIEPDNMTREGFSNYQWCSDEGLNEYYYFWNKVNNDITLYAKWFANMSIGVYNASNPENDQCGTFDFEGSGISSLGRVKGNFNIKEGTLKLTANPAEGYQFKGFYKGTIGSSGFVETPTENLLCANSEYNRDVENTAICAVFECAGHQWEQKVQKATPTADGRIYRTCGICGAEETISPLLKVSKISLARTSYTYTGKALKPAVTVKAGTKTLKSGTDYNVVYSNNTKVGKASAKVTLKGHYKGSKTATFKIFPKKAGISKAVPGKKLVKVTMSTKVSATGGTVYQIQYRIKGAAKWKTTTTKNKTKTIKKLKKGKQYQIRVRAYKSVSGSKYYGAWSKVKTTKKVK